MTVRRKRDEEEAHEREMEPARGAVPPLSPTDQDMGVGGLFSLSQLLNDSESNEMAGGGAAAYASLQKAQAAKPGGRV